MGECITSVWSRVTGFFRPVSDWNPGKKSEKKDRKLYDLKEVNSGETKKGEHPSNR